jgi:hypothetical protein
LAVDVLGAAGKFLQRGSPAPERLGTGRVDLEDDGAAEGRFLGKHREKRPQPDGDASERIALAVWSSVSAMRPSTYAMPVS